MIERSRRIRAREPEEGSALGELQPFVDAEALRNHLAAIVASSDDAIISKTLEGVIVSWNAGAERVFGYRAEEVIGLPITLVIPADHIHEEPAILERIRLGERIDHYQTVRKRKDGTLIDISLTVSPIRNAAGQIVGASKIARDISEQKRAADALKASDARIRIVADAERAARAEAERLSHVKDEFLATLSHELRTPLNAILGWADLLRRLPPDSPDQLRGLETIERNARVQSQIIADLLDMSRIISGKVQLDMQQVLLGEIINAAVEVVRPSMEAKNLHLRTMLDASGSYIRGDPGRLQQVMWNLLTNAVKFTPANGLIDVVMERLDSQVEVRVSDSGIGIRSEFLPLVFDRFRQADASTTRRHGGLGLGLSIVKHLVEMHGGSVSVYSSGEGRGATFAVTLPVVAVRAAVPGWFEPHHPVELEVGGLELPSLAGITALVVDDEADSRILIERLIQERGGRVVLAASASEALAALSAEPPDIMISDVGMPDVDGYELIQRIRSGKNSNTCRITAIALTAYARAEDRQRALLAGYQMHLAKPVDPRELVAGMASLLNRPGGLVTGRRGGKAQ